MLLLGACITKGGYTGKLSWNFGKKWGSSLMALTLPREDDDNAATADDNINNETAVDQETFDRQCEEFWKMLEEAANRLLSTSTAEDVVAKYDYKEENVALQSTRLGDGIMDAGQISAREKRIKKMELAKKKKSSKAKEDGDGKEVDDGPPVSVGHIVSTTAKDAQTTSTLILALLHGSDLITPLSNLGYIKILRADPKSESSIVCNKKKCELTVKFCVLPTASDVTPTAPSSSSTLPLSSSLLADITVERCMSREIRLEEGLRYQSYIKEQIQKKELARMKKLSMADQQSTSPSPHHHHHYHRPMTSKMARMTMTIWLSQPLRYPDPSTTQS